MVQVRRCHYCWLRLEVMHVRDVDDVMETWMGPIVLVWSMKLLQPLPRHHYSYSSASAWSVESI